MRKARLTFSGGGSLVINPKDEVTKTEMRVAFTISKSLSGSANTAEIHVWNLKESSRNAVGKELDTVELEAGYVPPEGGGNVSTIFKGAIRDVEHRRDGPDLITTVSCGDGDKAFRNATISKTFPAGTPVEDVVEEIYKQMRPHDVEKGEWKFPDDLPPYKRPYSICGPCTRELDRLGRSHRFYWSVQDQAMEIVPGDGALAGTVLITPETGMIDSPAITDNGVKVSALLNPAVRINRQVEIHSETLEMNAEGGLYRVSQLAFVGDNQEGRFAVELHGERIEGEKVDEGARE